MSQDDDRFLPFPLVTQMETQVQTYTETTHTHLTPFLAFPSNHETDHYSLFTYLFLGSRPQVTNSTKTLAKSSRKANCLGNVYLASSICSRHSQPISTNTFSSTTNSMHHTQHTTDDCHLHFSIPYSCLSVFEIP